MKKKIFALALAAVMLVSGAMTAMAAESVTITNTVWWDAWTQSWEVKDGETLEFDVDVTTGGAACYHNLNTVFANVATPGTEAPANTAGYAEYAVLRTDAYGWGDQYGNTTREGDNFYTGDDVDYATKNTGAHYDLTISRAGNVVTYAVAMKAGDATTYNYTWTMNATDLSAGCHVFFTGDAGVTMTVTPVVDEEPAPTPDDEIEQKGDMSLAFTAIVLVAGVALVAFASKKRFA